MGAGLEGGVAPSFLCGSSSVGLFVAVFFFRRTGAPVVVAQALRLLVFVRVMFGASHPFLLVPLAFLSKTSGRFFRPVWEPSQPRDGWVFFAWPAQFPLLPALGEQQISMLGAEFRANKTNPIPKAYPPIA